MPVSVAVSAQSIPSMSVDACSRIVKTAANSCIPSPVIPPATTDQPNWDALANSFASLSTAIAVGSVFITIILFVIGLAWGKITILKAEKEARDEARQCMDRWIAENAASEVRLAVDQIMGSTLNGNGANRADDFGDQE